MPIMKRPAAIAALAVLLFVFASHATVQAKNLLPRMPELVIEKGYSDCFQVVECTGRAQIRAETADTRIKVILKNISEKDIQSSLKVRLLYLVSENDVKLNVDGRSVRFDRKAPRVPFRLSPGQQLTVQVEARQGIQFNLDSMKKEIESETPRSEKVGEKVKFGLGEFTRFFEKENYGLRFMVGPLVSKWGIFPVEFQKVHLEIEAPRTFEAVHPPEIPWKRNNQHNSAVFSFDGADGFSTAVFLPKEDVQGFRKFQEKIASLTFPVRVNQP